MSSRQYPPHQFLIEGVNTVYPPLARFHVLPYGGILASPDAPQEKQKLIRDRVVTLLVYNEGSGGLRDTTIPAKITPFSDAAKTCPDASIIPKV